MHKNRQRGGFGPRPSAESLESGEIVEVREGYDQIDECLEWTTMTAESWIQHFRCCMKPILVFLFFLLF